MYVHRCSAHRDQTRAVGPGQLESQLSHPMGARNQTHIFFKSSTCHPQSHLSTPLARFYGTWLCLLVMLSIAVFMLGRWGEGDKQSSTVHLDLWKVCQPLISKFLISKFISSKEEPREEKHKPDKLFLSYTRKLH